MGELLKDRFMRQLPQTVERVVAQMVSEVPYYRFLPKEVLDGEISEFTKLNFRLFVRVLTESRMPTEEELAGPLQAAARRAREDVPLPAMLAVYNVAARVGLEVLREMAEESEMDFVLAAGHETQRYLQLLIPAVAAAYLEEQQALHSMLSEARRTLYDALVNGKPCAEAAERAAVTLASAYTVLFLHLPDTVTNTVVARRRVHRIQDIVEEHAGEPVLTALDGRGGTILLPATEHVDTLLESFSEISEHPVTVGISEADRPEAVAVAAREAQEVVELAQKLDRGPGLYRLSDMLVEYQLTRPGRARDRLAAAIEPLNPHPHLQQALEVYLQNEHGRQQAAKAIHVHPNTLDYRLRRVSELTGLDPALPSAARTLAAAMLAAKMT